MFLLFPKNSSAAKEKEEYIIYVYSMKYTEHTKACGNHCDAWPPSHVSLIVLANYLFLFWS